LLTERDKEIIRLINRFGCLTAAQVAAAFGMSERVAYRRLQKMVEARYLKYRRPLSGAGIYIAGVRGLEAVDAELGRFQVHLATLEHNLAVADVAILLLRRYPGARWVTERELRREAGQRFGVGWQGHVPDGLLVLPGGREVAVEYENTTKSRAAFGKVMRHYLRTDYAQVWFVCRTRRQADRLKELARSYDFVRILIFERGMLYESDGRENLCAHPSDHLSVSGDDGGRSGVQAP